MEIGGITTATYEIKYDVETATVHCQGIMRLSDKEYAAIMQLLNEVAALELSQITLDLRKLKVLNSSGVTMLGVFVDSVNEKKNTRLIMQCSKQVAWQKRTVKNFQLLMPGLQFEWE